MKSHFVIICLLLLGGIPLWADDFAAREKRCLEVWQAGEVMEVIVEDQRTTEPAFFAEFMQEVLLTCGREDFIRIWLSPLGSELRRNSSRFMAGPAVPDVEKQRVMEYIWDLFQHFRQQDGWSTAKKAESLQIFIYRIAFRAPASISNLLHEKIVEGVIAGQLTPTFIALDEFVSDEKLLKFLKRAPEPASGETLTDDNFPRFVILALKARLGDRAALTGLLEAWENMDPQQPMCNRFFPQLLAFTGQDEAIQLLFDVVEGEDIEALASGGLFPESLHINTVAALEEVEGFPSQLIVQGVPGIKFSITPYREWCTADNRKNYRLLPERLRFGLIDRSIVALNPYRPKKM